MHQKSIREKHCQQEYVDPVVTFFFFFFPCIFCCSQIDLGEEWFWRRDGFSENLTATFTTKTEKSVGQNHSYIFKAEHK